MKIHQKIEANGAKSPISPANGTTYTLKEVQEHVGGLVELVRLPGGKNIMLVDEEGLLKKNPVYNEQASALARRPIVGTAIVIPSSSFK